MPLVDILSPDRFSTYLTWSQGDVALAERLYSYNVQLSSDLYASMHMLEVALRNKADGALTLAHGNGWLHDNTVLADPYQQTCVSQAQATLQRERKAATHSQMVAELNFGFWSSLFGRTSNHLWANLRPIFQTTGLQRATIAEKLRNLRRLRNRIAHYEPILAQPIPALHQDILNLTAWMSVDASAWITTHSNLNYPATSLIVTDPQTGAPIFDQALVGHLPN
ncbi:Abi family protein [Rhizobium sp. 2MFCol3.1]|uniref:Abi family protein n=1 Tax=Rhizobium sp. 2MFCol3.1 TaxID=1246459 RepID=UPI00055B37DC|nr:Abi family protein [Rhizobium sp. 2MFCol3.1]